MTTERVTPNAHRTTFEAGARRMAERLGSADDLDVFGEALAKHLPVYEGVSYTAYIIPGLIMMSMLQNAFANPASSLIQSKISGNLAFILMPSIPAPAVTGAYLAAALLRSVLVGAGLWAGCMLWARPPVESPMLLVAFGFFGAVLMGSFGIITALWSEKYDQMGALQNFVVMPLTFLSGVFYSVDALPDFWRAATLWNPFFYLVDGFRYGFFGAGAVEPLTSLAVAAVTAAVTLMGAAVLLARGWRIRS